MPETQFLETISPSALFITFPFSDGDVSRRPDNMKEPPASASEVNWHRTMSMDEKYTCRWRNLIGQGIANMMNKPEKERHCLGSWPEGYWLFDHNKGQKKNPRHDLYLYGSKTVLRFRSPAEFIPHGYWLLTDPTLDRRNCGCKYCGGGGGGKRTQTEISEALGLPSNRGAGVAPRMRVGTLSRRPARPPKTFPTALPPTTLPADSPWIPPLLREPPRAADHWHLTSANLTCSSSNTRISDLTSTRKFRIGELVWCIFEEERGNVFGRPYWPYWPSIVIDTYLHAEAEVLNINNGVYSVAQTRRYWLLRLGTLSEEDRPRFEYLANETDIVPWHVFPLNADLEAMVPNEQTTSFLLGIFTAKRLLMTWAVFNRHYIEQDVPTTRYPSISGFDNLLSVSTYETTTSELSGSQSKATMTPPPSLLSVVPGQDIAQGGPTRLGSPKKKRITSVSPSEVLPPFTGVASQSTRVNKAKEIRYEGLWYGAERIWVGDTVRLCPEREAFSNSLDASREGQFSPNLSNDSHPRAVLMRIDKICVLFDENDRKECLIAGPLFEISKGEGGEFRIEESRRRPASLSVPKPDATMRPWDTCTSPPTNLPPSPIKVPSIPWGLPRAPIGYTTKPLLPPNTEFNIPLSFVAGRYYPDLLHWLPSKAALVTNSTKAHEPKSHSNSCRGPTTQDCIHSLCGLVPGKYNSAMCVNVSLADRSKTIEDAAEYARKQLRPGGEVMDDR